MNKKLNTVLFILGATVVNILTMLILIVAGIWLIGQLPVETQENIGQVLFILVFLIAIAGSFFTYNRLIKYISNKIDMDKYFHPIFRQRGGKKPE